MVFLILLFFYFFPRSVLATPDIKIIEYSVKTPEWIEIQNNSSESIILTNWYFKDADSHTKVISGCISANSKEVYEYSGFLNDDGDSLRFYDKDNNLIHDIGVLEITQKEKPLSTNTCIIPTSTPTPTLTPANTPTPTNIPTPTNTPTPDPTITNPPNGISLTEFMPYSDPEWIEIYNNNDYPVKLVSWKVEDLAGNTKNIDSLSISAKGYAIYELKSLIFDNNSDEKVILRNQENKIITQTSYGKGQLTLDRAWSYVSGSWCQASITKGYVNVTSCYIAPTSTEPTPTPTSDPTKYTADETATESAIIEPKSESSFITPDISPEPSPSTGSLVLGNSTSSSTSPKKNYLPLILIIGGGVLLVSPAVITKIRSQNEKNN